jgi:hypothetical protein
MHNLGGNVLRGRDRPLPNLPRRTSPAVTCSAEQMPRDGAGRVRRRELLLRSVDGLFLAVRLFTHRRRPPPAALLPPLSPSSSTKSTLPTPYTPFPVLPFAGSPPRRHRRHHRHQQRTRGVRPPQTKKRLGVPLPRRVRAALHRAVPARLGDSRQFSAAGGVHQRFQHGG